MEGKGCRPVRERSRMFLTMLSARRPCWAILSRFPFSVAVRSSIPARRSAAIASLSGATESCSSSSRSINRSEKLLTKLRGCLISWAIPAVSCPSEIPRFGAHAKGHPYVPQGMRRYGAAMRDISAAVVDRHSFGSRWLRPIPPPRSVADLPAGRCIYPWRWTPGLKITERTARRRKRRRTPHDSLVPCANHH
jgi:hypothetical protein